MEGYNGNANQSPHKCHSILLVMTSQSWQTALQKSRLVYIGQYRHKQSGQIQLDNNTFMNVLVYWQAGWQTKPAALLTCHLAQGHVFICMHNPYVFSIQLYM